MASLPLCSGCAQPGPTQIGVTPQGSRRGLRRTRARRPSTRRRRPGRRGPWRPSPASVAAEGSTSRWARTARCTCRYYDGNGAVRSLGGTGPRGAREGRRRRAGLLRPSPRWSAPRPPPRRAAPLPPPATSSPRPAWRSTTTARSTSATTTAPPTASCSPPATAPRSPPRDHSDTWAASTPPWRSRPTAPSSTWRGTAVENQDLRMGIQGDVQNLPIAAPSPTPAGGGRPSVAADLRRGRQGRPRHLRAEHRRSTPTASWRRRARTSR